MASSRGRERLRERGGRLFVFGSSTPRDLSHMNKIPRNLRSYDARIEKTYEGPALKEIMEKARSLTRDVGDGRNFVFGSSTPRDLAHMTSLHPRLRRYDAAPPKKSQTSPNIQTPVKRSTTAPPINRQTVAIQKNITTIPKVQSKDDDVSSEPDYVQDRLEFLRNPMGNGTSKKEEDLKEKASEAEAEEKSINVGKDSHENTSFSQAPEMMVMTKSSERIPHNTHEEEGGTASQHTIVGMDDQIVVAELNASTPDGEDRRPSVDTSSKLNHIMKKVEAAATRSQEGSDDLKGMTKYVEVKEVASNAKKTIEEKSKAEMDSVDDTSVSKGPQNLIRPINTGKELITTSKAIDIHSKEMEKTE